MAKPNLVHDGSGAFCKDCGIRLSSPDIQPHETLCAWQMDPELWVTD